MDRRVAPVPMEILSDDDPISPSPKKRRAAVTGDPQFVIISDDPTPQKPNPSGAVTASTPLFVPETPLSNEPTVILGPAATITAGDASIVRCSLSLPSNTVPQLPRFSNKFDGVTGLICLESDSEAEDRSFRRTMKEAGNLSVLSSPIDSSRVTRSISLIDVDNIESTNPSHSEVLPLSSKQNEKSPKDIISQSYGNGPSDCIKVIAETSKNCNISADDPSQLLGYDGNEPPALYKKNNTDKRKGDHLAVVAAKRPRKDDVARKTQSKEERARLVEERRKIKEQEKQRKAALKAEEAQRRKLQKEQMKWENGKYALESIIAEIDSKVLEKGKVGGQLLTRLSEAGVSFRITSNPIEKSILWKFIMPDNIAQLSISMSSELPYISVVYEADEFSDLVKSESLFDHVHRVQSRYPSFTICFLTNRLMSYINRCEQSHYKNASEKNWRRPPVEDVISRLTTDFMNVHSRQCRDEAELAEHVVGLTTSLAKCFFRKKITWLSVNANGSVISNDCIDKKLIKKDVWLKALIAIPKVQPRHALAIAKKYPTMRSLLDIYMDPNKTIHEKEFLLQDLPIEDILGKDMRLGVNCSKRVYRILMAQNGSIITDDIEDGADYFKC